MYLGIDLGTSAVKAILVDDTQRVVASASRALTSASPRPGHSEQEPADWIDATFAILDALKTDHPRELADVEGIGLSGQMHGATLLDATLRPLRPCILWNDGRSAAECRILEERWPALRATTGNKAMPGFTAPKLLWVAAHEPEIFAATRIVLLPKAYLRLILSGEVIEDVSDASGSLWLDVARRDWSDDGLSATGLSRQDAPRITTGFFAIKATRGIYHWLLMGAPFETMTLPSSFQIWPFRSTNTSRCSMISGGFARAAFCRKLSISAAIRTACRGGVRSLDTISTVP